MIQGMTGFGSSDKGGYRVEVRSLNHRYTDIIMKIPHQLGQHEVQLRNMLKERFDRGRFEIYVSLSGDESMGFKINRRLVGELCDALRSIKDEFSLAGDVGLDTIAAWRNLLIEEEPKADSGALFDAFAEALGGLETMRIAEGESLRKDIEDRVNLISSLNEEIASMAPAALEESRAELIKRVREVLEQAGVEDESRLNSELCSWAEKSDISEEVTRIRSHSAAIGKMLLEGGTMGRRLDFLLQELNREANTIASKTGALDILNRAVEIKAEVERMREQAQNIQ